MVDMNVVSQFMAHEKKCAVRWDAMDRYLNRLEIMMWGFNVAIIFALFTIVMRFV
jgi:hypothetical protein|tara:strand:+ start:348 stop:512 length:165 start_codon:yes stop_codon:yes gene_type:complete